MQRIPIAHINEQGQNIIIVPLDQSYGYKSVVEQRRVILALQSAASSARLVGTIVPVWNAGSGRMGFIAPEPWYGFFQSLSLPVIVRLLNRELICH